MQQVGLCAYYLPFVVDVLLGVLFSKQLSQDLSR